MIFLTAGHNTQSTRKDPGAVANGYKEADLTVELRNLTTAILRGKNAKVWNDYDTDNLATTVSKIKSGPGSVICDLHFNAGPPSATGVEVIVPVRATAAERKLAENISQAFANIMGIRNRGVKTEADTRHGRLAIMQPEGINVLVEVCFISNKADLDKYLAQKKVLAAHLADLLIVADGLL